MSLLIRKSSSIKKDVRRFRTTIPNLRSFARFDERARQYSSVLARHFLWRSSSWDYRRSCWVDSANLWRTQKDSVTPNLHLLQINSAPSPQILPVFVWMSLSKQQILDFLASFLRLLTQCAQSVRSDASINCKAPNLSALVFASISYKIERLVECVRVVQKFFKSWKLLKRSERSRNSPVQKPHSSWMDDPMNENRNLVTL